ncbi:condensin-2 complex subunit D3-like [Nylanderia fulva]|uniref:condensin-2 complex subunit D3-like n=1 Tax=Nylanderia fulva TaxID=613905 RepID=UPI0010FB6920|nr:condensin-2 complex subunit D3-like [Nylanderia fulva]
MESLRVLHNFRLDDLDADWIRSVWEAEFLTYHEPPEEYLEHLESGDAKRALHESRRALEGWIVDNEHERESSEYSWQALMSLSINVRGLLATLGYIMKTGQCKTDRDSRQGCLEATRLYIMLLTVPGSNAFGIYHPNLYQRAIRTLKMSDDLVFPSVKKGSKNNVINSSVEDKSTNCYVMLDSEKLKLVKELNKIVCDLVTMLKSFRFKEHAESLDVTIHMLLDITRLEMYIKSCNNYGLTTLSKSAFVGLQELCSNNHGTVAIIIMSIVQYMLPDLLFHHTNVQPKCIIIVHEAVMNFLKSLLKIHETETVQAVVTLIHQLMVKCPERAEGRQKQATVVIRLLNICNEDLTTSVFKDIILFSHNNKISYRLFAQEIIGKLLTESSLSNNSLNKDMTMKMRRILVAVVSSRCMDQSILVRGKALATLASFSDCSSDADQTILERIFKDSVSDKPFPTLEELERALSQDTDPLPGSHTVVTMLLERVSDERALVQRSALKILRNLSIMFPPLTDRMMHVISDRCKDPTLTVRQFAVHVLSELLEQFPHNLSLLDKWTQAVVPQIYDIEAKVQEKVLECLGNVLLNRIKKASTYTPDAANNLPWRVLEKLSNLRMRKHLSKACGLWIKNGVVNNSMIIKLQSHIDTDNNIGAWILLAALAENMTIPTIDKYIADYKEIIQKNDYHASLVLHVLRHAWSVLDRDCLEDLHQHLYKCVSRFEITFNLISICLDILSAVLQYLYAEKSSQLMETNMLELMKLSEMEIQDSMEGRLDGSNNLTQETLQVRAICTLGHASLLCTNRISSSTLRALERLLLRWESLPEAAKETKNLQASAVVILCQQALRDREIAKKITPILGNLMRQETNSDSPVKFAVKINAAKALADICVRFTDLVEPYLPDMCISMKDSNSKVREAIVVIFIQLLLEDFIKLKGPFFFHILTMLSDTDDTIRELTIFLVEEKLLVKNKTLISKQFLESIYHYNHYRSRNVFCGHRMSEREKKLLTLPGRVNQDKRNAIYEFMLEHLDASAKLTLIKKLTKNILGEICDHDTIDIMTEEGECVLKDTVFIIGNNRLQLSLGEKQKDDAAAELDEASPNSSTPNNNAANANVVAMKKHNLDNLLPMLIVLKKKLTAMKSRLEDDVESLLFRIYSEYDEEHLLGVLNEYPELEKEMNLYQRKLRDKTVSESDNDRNANSSFNISHSDNSKLVDLCKQSTPKIILHRLSPSTIMHYKDRDRQERRSVDSDINSMIYLDRLSIQTPPPEPNLVSSTPVSIKKSYSRDSSTPRLHRSSNERELPEFKRRKYCEK